MFKPRRDKFSNKHKGGGTFDGKFGNFNKSRGKGDGGFGGGGGGGWDREEHVVFDAVCDRCGSPCTVPFKPTGSRPVLCKRCFKEGDGGQKHFGGKGRERQSFQRDDRDFRKGGDFRQSNDRQPDLKGLERQLNDINRKLDLLLGTIAPRSSDKKKKGGKKEKEVVKEEADEDDLDVDDVDVDDDPIDDDDMDDDEDLDDEEDFDDDEEDEDDLDDEDEDEEGAEAEKE
jgi:CxxC-x17-CxxC domain-containing protein